MIALLLVLQATVRTVPPSQEGFDRIDFDLSRVKPAADEIVVIAHRENQRLPPLPAVPEEALPRAETGIIGDLRGSVTLEKQALPGGVVSNRAMMTLKLPF